MKRFMCGLLVGLILSFTTPVLADTQVISVFYNGKQIQSDVPPAIIDGRLMVPLRMIGEAMDVQVDWDADKQRVDIVQPIHILKHFPRPLTTNGAEIIGSDGFKKAVGDAMILLAQKAPEEFKLVRDFLALIKEEKSTSSMFPDPEKRMATVIVRKGECFINWQAFQKAFQHKSRTEKNIIFASMIVHEAAHSYIHQKGIDFDARLITMVEHEVLAHARHRQVLHKLNASQSLIDDLADLNKVVDTDYDTNKY